MSPAPFPIHLLTVANSRTALSLLLLLLLQLYEQFGEWYYVTSNLTLISRSVLRNTASRYGGLEYMTGDRAQIAAGMQADLNVAFAQFHATISEVCAAIGSNCSSRPLLLHLLHVALTVCFTFFCVPGQHSPHHAHASVRGCLCGSAGNQARCFQSP